MKAKEVLKLLKVTIPTLTKYVKYGEFQKMLNEVIEYKIKTVIISNKDRLTRISFDV